jgi:hypothetical protein
MSDLPLIVGVLGKCRVDLAEHVLEQWRFGLRERPSLEYPIERVDSLGQLLRELRYCFGAKD